MRTTNRQWRLSRRPKGLVCADDFILGETSIPDIADGEVLVRNDVLSCDPTQRSWMAYDTYMPAVPIGDVMRAIAGGEVVRSRARHFQPGQRVQGIFGWQDYACVRPEECAFMTVVPDGIPLENGMSVLGLTGITAYFGLLDVGRVKAGETVLVSGAAGATGSVVGQIAKILGCRVVGIAGTAEKCRYLTDELGFDAAIDYRNENLLTRLRVTCPRGIDVFFDNVGGAALDAALSNLAMGGRIVLCGAISTYNADAPASGPKGYLRLLTRRGRMEGFVVTDYMARASEATGPLAAWFARGRIKDRVDVVHGFENAPAALARLFSGENRGKQLVRISE